MDGMAAFTDTVFSRATPCIDTIILSDVRATMGAKFPTVLNLYLKDSEERLRDIDVALVKPSRDALILAAHSLRSSSAHLGAMRLSNIAASIEMAATDNTPIAPDALPRIRQVFNETRDRLKLYLPEAGG